MISLRRMMRNASWMVPVSLALTSIIALAEPETPSAKVCIAHAGASEYAPVHTLAAYAMALEMEADYVEQDLQLTKDGILICIHDDTLERSTNVENMFPKRHRTVERDGMTIKTWPVIDFTLEEIRTLDVGSWFDPSFADQRIVTFQESIDLVKGKAGIYPEIKVSEYVDESKAGDDIVVEVHRVLTENGLHTIEGQRTTPVVIQCFHPEVLKRLRKISDDAYHLNQLVWTTQIEELLTPDGMAEVSKYADVLGPTVGMLLEDKSRIETAQRLGLLVHPWFLSQKRPSRFEDMGAYYEYLLYEVGFDGLFTDDPDNFPRHRKTSLHGH